MFNRRYDKCYHTKLINCGSVLEVIEYGLPVVRSSRCNRIGRAGQGTTSVETKRDNRGKTAYRARQTVRNMANVNFSQNSKFVTLTFAENVVNVNQAYRMLSNFFKRLKRYLKKPPQYIAVLEFQKRGAIHFHVLMNIPYIPHKELERLWGHGFVKINQIDDTDNIGAYITKYMTKENMDERLAGQKSYTMSRNLKKPEETTDAEVIEAVLADVCVKRVAYTAEFESEYYGSISYTQLILERSVTLSAYRKPQASGCFPPLWGVCKPLPV